MDCRIRAEYGFSLALKGMKFSFEDECPLDHISTDYIPPLDKTALALAGKDKGHNKFLEFIDVWIDIRATLKWWKQMDTYRVGVSKLSKSTMHTIMRRPLTPHDFGYEIPQATLVRLNNYILLEEFNLLVDELPSGYLQTRRVKLSYKNIREILLQRRGHKLKEWEEFIDYILNNLRYPELLGL